MPNKPVTRARAVTRAKKDNIPKLLALARSIHDAMAADPVRYPNPVPTLTILLALIVGLETAQATLNTRVRGASAVRNKKRDDLFSAIESERGYVQSLCDAKPEEAEALIKGAAMDVAQRPMFHKPILAANPGTQPGTAILVANERQLVGAGVHKKVTFNWQMSTDNGKTWVSLPSTPHARTEVTGLTPLTTYMFRVCVTVGKTVGEWSQPVTMLAR